MHKKYLTLILLILLVAVLSAEVADKVPLKAMLYSAVPGGGQIYNQKYLKAGIVIGIQGYLIGSAVYNDAQRDKFAGKARKELNPALKAEYDLRKKEYFEKLRNDYWWIGITAVLATADAFVDAHLHDFEKRKRDVELKFSDKMLLIEYNW